jgi:hypothetical protein
MAASMNGAALRATIRIDTRGAVIAASIGVKRVLDPGNYPAMVIRPPYPAKRNDIHSGRKNPEHRGTLG